MMSDLFSSLDCNQIKLSAFLWAVPFLLVLCLNKVWSMSVFSLLKSKISGIHFDAKKELSPLTLMVYSVMLFIMLMNMFGLIPYAYGFTSNLWPSIGMALVFWGLLLSSGATFNYSATLAHLTPAGAPGALAPFLVLIESLSIMIRPLTLTVRLIANISAGHIVLALIANSMTAASGFNLVSLFFLNIGYSMFEIFVCVIQAYIFSLLLKLYGEEHS